MIINFHKGCTYAYYLDIYSKVGNRALVRRWFPAGEVTAPEARFLDVILYSAEQIAKEHLAMPGSSAAAVPPSAPWGIISIKAQVGAGQKAWLSCSPN